MMIFREISSISSFGTELSSVSSFSVSVICQTAISALLSSLFLRYSAISLNKVINLSYETNPHGAPIYDKPVRADHAHTQKDASSSPEGVPITIKTVWDKGSSDLGSVDNFCSVNIGLGGSTFQSVFESAANIVKSFQIVKFYFNL